MIRSPLKLLLILIIGITFATFLKNHYQTGLLFDFGLTPKFESYVFTKLEKFRNLILEVGKWRNLTKENEELISKNRDLTLRLAKCDDLVNENQFLRKSLNISTRFKQPVVYGSIFNLSLNPDGYNVLLNKGSNDGVSENGVVITSEGLLVGRVEKVFETYSRVLYISDPKFKVIAKIVNSNTAGIAKGALNEGMQFDLIVQGDEIKEGDMVISTGNDFFPPALIIGSVEHVQVNDIELFKKVRIRPAVKDLPVGRVLVLEK